MKRSSLPFHIHGSTVLIILKVVDTITGERLPYVACYACKVLYTDTGGGTGNMTRHRCPLGNSYKDKYVKLEIMYTVASIAKIFEIC